MQMPQAKIFVWLLLLVVVFTKHVRAGNEEHLRELVSTETSLIDALKEYIEALEQQLLLIKKETSAIEEIHELVGNQVEEHMSNPLNVLTILKRFQSVWPLIEQQANNTLNLADTLPFSDMELQLPSEEDYQTALLNLLRLQSVYDLKPDTLSLGIVNGLKLGSVMSWSDCLEMARKLDRNGDYAVAKFWLETAMGKLPAAENSTSFSVSELERGKVQILEASLNMDYRAGDFLSALTTAKELLLLRPTNQNVLKAKVKLERAINGTQKKLLPKQKRSKSVEQQLIDELCRAATKQKVSTGSRLLECRQNIGYLQMLRLEQLNEDPHIMLYHDVLSLRQTDKLISLLDDEPQEMQTNRVATFAPMQVSKLGQKLLRGINYQMDLELEQWQARRHSHEHVTEPEVASTTTGHVARVMLNLQESKLGGALAFPQLELSVNVPRGSILLWHIGSFNELPRLDYRSRQIVCPVLLGTQLSLWTET